MSRGQSSCPESFKDDCFGVNKRAIPLCHFEIYAEVEWFRQMTCSCDSVCVSVCVSVCECACVSVCECVCVSVCVCYELRLPSVLLSVGPPLRRNRGLLITHLI